ncbi:MAG: hypothetical protein AW08_03360 [Candidatus Accumulibacter adjunctus]|uniref:Uncharacterized protein n=1 Tax=Candidatus Accumulibacter adjunctus TaxID=1454001 RepID=A0A011NKQ5_9PROT|nr:MAG: hypothetical protein AW08_03360 [Candidatus Accumulibacter adjunctus]
MPSSASPKAPATATCTATRNCASGSSCRRVPASGWRSCAARVASTPCSPTIPGRPANCRRRCPKSDSATGSAASARDSSSPCSASTTRRWCVVARRWRKAAAMPAKAFSKPAPVSARFAPCAPGSRARRKACSSHALRSRPSTARWPSTRKAGGRRVRPPCGRSTGARRDRRRKRQARTTKPPAPSSCGCTRRDGGWSGWRRSFPMSPRSGWRGSNSANSPPCRRCRRQRRASGWRQ